MSEERHYNCGEDSVRHQDKEEDTLLPISLLQRFFSHAEHGIEKDESSKDHLQKSHLRKL